MTTIWRANTNIALIKYWGKRDETLFLPMNSSLSLTLDAFYTDTKVQWADTDSFILNGKTQDVSTIQPFLNLFRQATQQSRHIAVESINHVPTAAGLASSASAFAALAGALNQLTGANMDLTTLSSFARQGSGSATRSIFGGFVEWQAGTDSQSSIAVPIDNADWGLSMIVITINARAKDISSRAGMKHTVATSVFYQGWLDSVETDLLAIKQAIAHKNIQKTGEIMEYNAMKMHASMLGANPPFTYWEPESLLAMQLIRQLRQEGHCCYFTMDAGPNVKVLCPTHEVPAILTKLKQHFAAHQLITSGIGKGIRALSNAQWEESCDDYYRTSSR